MDLLLPVLLLATIWPLFATAHGGHAHQHMGARGESEAIVDAHNKVRKAAKAVAMNKLTWSDELATNAAIRSKTCNSAPGNDTQLIRNVGRFTDVGENTYFAPGRKPNYGAAVRAWASEAKHYDATGHACAAGKTCQNYTQLVWWDTESVGCAATKCEIPASRKAKSGYFIVCQYGPAGNKQSAAPFIRATPSSPVCSQCPKGSVCITRENLCTPPANSTLLPDYGGGEVEEKEPEVTKEVEIDGEVL